MRFKFSRDEVYETEGPKKGHKFLEGQEFNFEPNFAERWARRGAGEVTDPHLDGGVGRDGPFEPLGEKSAKAPKAEKPAKAPKAADQKTPLPADPVFEAGNVVFLAPEHPDMAVQLWTVTGLNEDGSVAVTRKDDDDNDVAEAFPAKDLLLYTEPQI